MALIKSQNNYTHQLNNINSEEGIHGLRYFKNSLEVYNGVTWIQIGDGSTPPSPIEIPNISNTFAAWSPSSIDTSNGSIQPSKTSYTSEFISLSADEDYHLVLPEGISQIVIAHYNDVQKFVNFLNIEVNGQTTLDQQVLIPSNTESKFIKIQIASNNSTIAELGEKIIKTSLVSSVKGILTKRFIFNREIEVETASDNTQLNIISVNSPNGIVKTGSNLNNGSIQIKGVQEGSYYVSIVLTHVKSSSRIVLEKYFNIAINELKNIDLTSIIPEYSRLGFYDVYISIEEIGIAKTIASYYIEKTLYLVSPVWEYYYEDDMESINKVVVGEVGSLSSHNVNFTYVLEEDVDYHRITINNPANTMSTGQVMSKLPITYGSFEVRMKVPNSNSILNGFFLFGYDPLDETASYEIDMEVLKQKTIWQLWTTIHNSKHHTYGSNPALEPGEVFQEKINLSFNPVTTYHNYKINFYENYISFEVDGVEVSRWNEKFVYRDMRLYVGNFYTHWLGQTTGTVNRQMDIEWIRRTYLP